MSGYDLYEASRSLGRLNLDAGNGMSETESYWCRVVLAERENYNPKPHRHSFYELHLCLAQSGAFEVCGKEITLTRDQYLLVSPSAEHRIVSQPQGFRKFIWGFRIRDERVESALAKSCPDYITGNASSDILCALDIILSNAYERKFGYFDIIKGQLSCIFALIVRDICDIGETRVYGKKQSLIANEIKSYISDNIRNSPSPQDIAAQFSRSVGWVDKICISEFGVTASALKKRIQLERIKELLAYTDHNLDTISDICGFADRFTMGKFFRKHEGMPPGEFRRSNRR